MSLHGSPLNKPGQSKSGHLIVWLQPVVASDSIQPTFCWVSGMGFCCCLFVVVVGFSVVVCVCVHVVVFCVCACLLLTGVCLFIVFCLIFCCCCIFVVCFLEE